MIKKIILKTKEQKDIRNSDRNGNLLTWINTTSRKLGKYIEAIALDKRKSRTMLKKIKNWR